MANPKVSVILSAFNEERYIEEAVRSILGQTFEDFELILIDDYSTDRTLEICRSLADPRVRIYSKRNEPRNLASSRNIGVRMARGDYIAFQDADDCCDPARIEAQVAKAMENPGRRVVGCAIRRIEGGKEWTVRPPETHREIIKGFNRLYGRTTIVSGTILAPRSVLVEIPYRLKFKYMQDWDQMLRMYERGDVVLYNCQTPLYTYFIRKKGARFRPDWPDYNIFVRYCQECRRRGLEEPGSLREFYRHLGRHPLANCRWAVLRGLIDLKRRLDLRL